jgi:hypothetical protein
MRASRDVENPSPRPVRVRDLYKPMITDADLLEVFDALPDLLAMAEEIKNQDGGYRYEIQDKLREEHRKKGIPFKWSMPYRHIDRCDQCDYNKTAIKHELENPKIKDRASPLYQVVIWDIDIHKIREHGQPFPDDCRLFLTQLIQEQDKNPQ